MTKLTKTELVERIAGKTKLSKVDAKKALEAIEEVISEEVSSGLVVTLPKLGSFLTKHRKARQGINPLTKEKINIAETYVPRFKPNKAFKEAIKDKIIKNKK